jgi:hypothetical protein
MPQAPSLAALSNVFGSKPPVASGAPTGAAPAWMQQDADQNISTAPDPDLQQWLADVRVSKLKSQGWSAADIMAANATAASATAEQARPPSMLPFEQEQTREDLQNRAGHAGADLSADLAPELNATADYNATQGARRNFIPAVHGWWDEQNQAALARAAAPAQAEAAGAYARQGLANQGEVDKAATAAAGRFNRPQSEQDKDFLSAIADLAGKGGFGIDPDTGRPMSPPKEIADKVTAAIGRMGTGGAPAPATPGVLTAKDLQDYVDHHPGMTLNDARNYAITMGWKVQ